MDGIIVINKEKDYTSHDVVAIVKKIFKEKVGHTGTLDPNATGVLPLLIGKGTKLSKYLIDHDKIYKATLKLGIKTDTADITGKIIEEIDVGTITEEMIKNVLQSFIGQQEQYPPMYSAIKVNGKKLYEYARSGKEVEVKPRSIEIYDIKLDNFDKPNNEIVFTVECSKGTYIRTLCENIAEKLITIGCMEELERVQVGRFNISNAVTIDELKEKKDDISFLNTYFYSFEKILEDKESLKLKNDKIQLFLNGVKLKQDLPDGIYKIMNEEDVFIGTGVVEKGMLKRDIII